jgi:hypothetical protein
MQIILFFLADPASEVSPGWLSTFVSELQNAREWTCSSPQHEHHSDSSSCSRPDDLPIVTAGFSVCLDRASTSPNLELEKAYYDDLLFIVDQVARISSSTGTEWEIEVDGELVGTVEEGKLDDGGRMNLLGAWIDLFGSRRQ